MVQSTHLLSQYISAKETNLRYLGLDTLTHLAACSDSLEILKHHFETILVSLNDKDISVRRYFNIFNAQGELWICFTLCATFQIASQL